MPAIIGLVKAGSGLLNNLRKAYLKAEQMDKEIGRKLTLYKKFFEKHKDVAKVSELSGVVLSQWTGGFSDFGFDSKTTELNFWVPLLQTAGCWILAIPLCLKRRA